MPGPFRSYPRLASPAMAAVMLCLLASSCAASQQQLLSKVTAWGSNSARVQLGAPGATTLSAPIVSVIGDSPPQSTPSLASSDASFGGTEAISGNLKVVVDSAGMMTATRVSDGTILLQQTSLSWGDPTGGSKPGSVSVTVRFARDPEHPDSIYGLGEHKDGKVQRAPYKKKFADSLYYGYSQGGDVSIPYYGSSCGYGFVWNTPSLGSVDIADDYIEWVSNATKGVDVWITTTPSFVDLKSVDPLRSVHSYLLRQYVDVSGHPSPMPFWTTGFIQCKDRYRNQTQLLDVARGYVERGLPISMIVIGAICLHAVALLVALMI
eukprot:SAG31_NODE_7509_length_1669_cov_1.020382_2_plen_322_part_00